jgi:hypothetical protein
MELYLTYKSPEDREIENAPSTPEIDFFREYINVADEGEVRQLALDSNLEENAFDFLLNGEDSVGGDYDMDEEELAAMKEEYGEDFETGGYTPVYHSADGVLSAIESFINLHPDHEPYREDIKKYLNFCIENDLKVTNYSGF